MLIAARIPDLPSDIFRSPGIPHPSRVELWCVGNDVILDWGLSSGSLHSFGRWNPAHVFRGCVVLAFVDDTL